jgi:hypothetical protein
MLLPKDRTLVPVSPDPLNEFPRGLTFAVVVAPLLVTPESPAAKLKNRSVESLPWPPSATALVFVPDAVRRSTPTNISPPP